jgi:WD40 repeat protein
MWEFSPAQEVTVLSGHSAGIEIPIVSPDRQLVVTASGNVLGKDPLARIWDANTGSLRAVLSGHYGNINAMAFSPDGLRIATASDDRTVKLWEAHSGQGLGFLQGHTKGVTHVAFSPSGHRILTASQYDTTARLWDAQTGKEIAILQSRRTGWSMAQFSPDGERIVTASTEFVFGDGAAALWDATTGKNIAFLQDFSRDGRYLLTGGRDKKVRWWSAGTGAELASFEGHTEWIVAVAVHPAGKLIASASYDKTVRIWNIENGATIASLDAFEHKMETQPKQFDLMFSPDGSRLLVRNPQSSKVRVWDYSRNKVLEFGESESSLSRVGFVDGGARLITTCVNGTVRLWDVSSGQEIAVFVGHTDDASALLSYSKGTRILTGSSDRTARVWRVFPDTQTLVDHAKTVTPRCLTKTERAQFLLSPEPPGWCFELGKWPYSGFKDASEWDVRNCRNELLTILAIIDIINWLLLN